jgi:Na+/H+ antiporter NhaD/arsenite permease-like protein
MPVDLTVAVPVGWLVPFALLLLAIAVLPLLAPHFWEHNRNKGVVAAALALPVAIWAWRTQQHTLLETGHEYVSFMLLLGSLFVVAGGLFLDGDLRATPKVNVAFLALGAVLANFVGTTGASMLLIRPLLRTNGQRRHVVHTVIFFIFIVCNIGGCLTPLGDPPLFVGFLRGVPFTWTLRLWPEWLAMNAALLAIYYAWDTRVIRRESPESLKADVVSLVPLSLSGKVNLLLLAGIVLTVATAPPGWREAGMAGIGLASLALTPRGVRERNAFAWGPIIEVAVLFAGIFVTMIPALEYLRQHGPELGVRSPLQFFWVTGSLSSFLDNTPTYLTMLALAQSLDMPREVVGVSHVVLTGISLGAVFMGANTYIGNGPNFMVKAIADSSGVKMPSFFGYMAYSLAILVPLFVVLGFLAL